MKKGDTIICKNEADLISTMYDLAKNGIDTDFDVDKDKGKWNLVVLKVAKDVKKHNSK